jgi:YggT family protein
MPELNFLYQTLMQLLSALVGIFLLRFLLQQVRADFRNPFAMFVVRVTNPLVLPLRRLLPPAGRVDTASVVAVILVQLAVTAVGYLLPGLGLPGPGAMLADAIVRLLETTLGLYQLMIFVYVLMSWVNTGGYNPLSRLLGQLCEPVLGPFRRALPSLGGLDISPIVVFFVIRFLQIVVDTRIAPLLGHLLG